MHGRWFVPSNSCPWANSSCSTWHNTRQSLGTLWRLLVLWLGTILLCQATVFWKHNCQRFGPLACLYNQEQGSWRHTLAFAEDLYKTINSIKAGNRTWKTYKFCYAWPTPSGPIPQWMEQEYELNAQDALVLVEHQLATSNFNGNFDYAPYQEFGPDSECV